MANIRVELKGADELARKLSQLSDAVQKQIALDAVTEGGSVIQFHAQNNAKEVFSEKQRGQLRNSIRVESKATGTGAEAEIGPHVIYGRIQEFGGTIRPVHAQALHWVLDGQDYFAKKVTIPARPYLRPAAEGHISQISDVMSQAIADGIAASV